MLCTMRAAFHMHIIFMLLTFPLVCALEKVLVVFFLFMCVHSDYEFRFISFVLARFGPRNITLFQNLLELHIIYPLACFAVVD